jgi:hypothetical protein
MGIHEMMRVAAAEEESSAARQLPQKARDLLCVRNCNDPSIHGANRIRLLSKKKIAYACHRSSATFSLGSRYGVLQMML